jgi:cytochrome c peroxidase
MKKVKTLLFIFFTIVLVYGFIDGNHATPYVFPAVTTFPEMPVAEDNPVTLEGVQLGRYLFYDPILSKDRNMNCASCHKQEFAFSDAPNTLSTGQNKLKMKRNTLPLFNLAWYPSFFWDGRASTLEQQILRPVRTHEEMDLDWKTAAQRVSDDAFYRTGFQALYGPVLIDSTLITKTIAQFLRTLISYRSRYDQVILKQASLTDEEYFGYELMNDMTKGDCLHCHTTDGNSLGTTATYSNNGLDAITDADDYKDKGLGITTGKKTDNGKFKIPSLRNLMFTAPYMHDGRFKTLEEVLDFYSEDVKTCVNIDSKMEFAHEGGAHLSTKEKKAIIAFLKTFTDSTFISDPAFSDPFLR